MDDEGEYLKTNEEQLIANYDIDFNFDGFAHSELIDRNLNMQCFLQTYTAKECIVCHPMMLV